MKKTKGIFKVDVRKTCKQCGSDITVKRFRSYCSAVCRTKFLNKKYYILYDKATIQRERNDAKASQPSSKKIKCLVCGKWYVQVCTHVFERHKMTAREYKKEYGLDVKKGRVPEWYSEVKGQQAIDNETYLNLKAGKKFWFKPGDPKAGRYKRSEETLERLKNRKYVRRTIS